MEALGFEVAGVHAGKTPLHTEMLHESISNWEIQNRRIRGRQDSVRDWPGYRWSMRCDRHDELYVRVNDWQILVEISNHEGRPMVDLWSKRPGYPSGL